MRDGDARHLLAHSRLSKPSGSLLAILGGKTDVRSVPQTGSMLGEFSSR